MKTIAKINNTKSGLLESMKKIHKHEPDSSTERENTQINKFIHEKGDIITHTTEISKDNEALQ